MVRIADEGNRAARLEALDPVGAAADRDLERRLLEIASFPNWVGTDMVRIVKMRGDRLTLTTPALSVGGASQTTELTWERAK